MTIKLADIHCPKVADPAFREYLADLTTVVALDLPMELLHRRVMDLTRLLLKDHPGFLPATCASDDRRHYSRHLLYKDPAARFVVMSLVWLPGQGTPIHDHQTWGVMGILEGAMRVENFATTAGSIESGHCEIAQVSTVLCGPNSVVYVLPPHEEIHKLQNPEPAGGERCVTLHIYGREMRDYHVFSLESGTVTLHEVDYDDDGAAS